MNILEEAEKLRALAQESAKKRGITVQEAWNEAIEIFKEMNNLKLSSKRKQSFIVPKKYIGLQTSNKDESR